MNEDIAFHSGDSGFVDRDHRDKSTKKQSSPVKSSPLNTGMKVVQSAAKMISHVDHKQSPERLSSPHWENTAVQTSPNIGMSWTNIPGAIEFEEDERTYSLDYNDEKKYFIYMIKDVNPVPKKECVGRITLPARRKVTLEQLRNLLLHSNDETIRSAAKHKFKYLSESYRLVVMPEKNTAVDQIYQTQGIFIKVNTPNAGPFAKRTRTKDKDKDKTNINKTSHVNTPMYGRTYRSTKKTKNDSEKSTPYHSRRNETGNYI